LIVAAAKALTDRSAAVMKLHGFVFTVSPAKVTFEYLFPALDYGNDTVGSRSIISDSQSAHVSSPQESTPAFVTLKHDRRTSLIN